MKKALIIAPFMVLALMVEARAESVDARPLIELAFDLVKVLSLAVVSSVVPWALHRYAKNLDANTVERARLAANALVQTAIMRAQAQIAERDMGDIEVQNRIVASALSYISDNGRNIMKGVGIDISSEAGRNEAAAKLAAVIAPSVLVAASVPETVTVAQAFAAVNGVSVTGTPARVDARIS